MLRHVTSYQLSEWMAFWQLEPFGFDADMLGHGITSSTYYNMNKKKSAPILKAQDFIPKEKELPKMSFVQALKMYFNERKQKQSKR